MNGIFLFNILWVLVCVCVCVMVEGGEVEGGGGGVSEYSIRRVGSRASASY
jgi:hypothetical protein